MKLPKKIAALLTVTLAASSVGNLGYADTLKSVSEDKLVGSGRWETAIEVSKKGWTKATEAVIVNDSAIADALAATPFAEVKNAPILLTGKDKLDERTLSELKRLGVTKVYLIGGEAVLSKAIENELANNQKLQVERIHGATRELTALEIANRLNKIKKVTEIAVVNGTTGLADAVSIAATAAKKDMAIILSNPSEGTKASDEFIKSNGIKTSYIIGGPKAISKEVESKLPNAVRIEGIDRNETNAKVLKTFYTEKELKNAYVAKDGMGEEDKLIDALAVGVLAAKNDSPVIIVGNKLNEMQKDITNTKSFKTVTQVGGKGNETAFNELITMQGVTTYEVNTVEELNDALAKANANDVINVRSLNDNSRNQNTEIKSENAITINIDSTSEKTLSIDIKNGTVKIRENQTVIYMESGELVIEGKISTVNVVEGGNVTIINESTSKPNVTVAEGASVEVDGKFNNITVNGKDSVVSVEKDSTVSKIEVSKDASGTVIDNDGKVDKVVSNAQNVTVENNGTVGGVSGTNKPTVNGNTVTPPSTGGGTVQVDKIAPEIVVNSHEDSVLTIANKINISGTANDNKAIASIEYRTSSGQAGEAEGTKEWSINELPLIEGENTITIIATDTSNNKAETIIKVEYKKVQDGESIELDNSVKTIILSGTTLKTINFNFTEKNDVTLVGAKANNLVINGSGTITLQDCEVQASENGTSAVTLVGEAETNVKLIANSSTLIGAEGGNGIEVPATSTLDLSGNRLVVEGNNRVETKDTIGGSGIGNAGETVGKIYIHDMKNITARGYGKHACGIGGVMADEIIIENSTINEVKGGIPQESFETDPKYGKSEPEGGVAIGVMVGSKSDKVTLKGITINKAIGGSKAAAIGAGYWAKLDLTIDNSELKNIQGGNASAGIGGSRIAENSTGDLWKININNSILENIKGGQRGSGIGSGYDTHTTKGSIAAKCIIDITGNSTIKDVVGGEYAAGIGTGYHAGGLKLKIDDSVKKENVSSGTKEYKKEYTQAEDIGYGVLDPNRSGYGVVVTKWDGTTKTVVKPVDDVYEVNTASELAWIADFINEGNTNISIKLVNDIDLNNQNWIPIGQTGSSQFMGSFDGNGHTIFNFVVDTTTESSEYHASGLFGWVNSATIKNLIIKNANVKGNQYVGAIAGYIESINQAIIENCHVINSQVAATGDKAGAVVGFGANAGTTIKNCTATESTVKAGRDAGQIVGCSKIELVIDCSAIYVTVSYDENYKGEKPNTNICNEVIGRVL